MQHLEYEEQKAIFQWARVMERKYPCLKWLNSSQNGIKITNKLSAVRAKATGLNAGYPDIHLPYPSGAYYSLFIELKRPIIKGKAKPVVSPEQREWIDYLNSVGFLASVCYGSKEAIELITKYLELGEVKCRH